MNVLRILISCTAATAVVGAIGFANAQSTDTTTPSTAAQEVNEATAPATQSPGAAMGSTMDSSTTPSDTSTTEPAAQADRN